MSVLEALGDWAEDEGFGTLGVDLFLARMPDAPDSVVALYEYDGGPPLEMLGPQGVSLHRVRVQFAGRAGRDDYPTVRDLMVSMYESVSTLTNVTVSGTRILRARPLGYPAAIGFDDKNRWRFAFNVEATVEP